MAELGSTLAEHGKRRIAFTIVVLAVLALFLVQSWKSHALVLFGWFDSGLGLVPAEPEIHFLHVGHRLHNIALSLMTWPFVFGMIAQIRSPTRHLTGMQMGLFVWLAGLVAIALTGVWPILVIVVVMGVPTLIAAALHPAGRELFTSVDVTRVNRVLLVLVVVAAVPLLAYAAHQTGLQTGAIEPVGHAHAGGEHAEIHQEHVGGGHYMRMVWLPLAIIGTGFLASLRQPGWWLGAWVAGLMAAVFGLSSVLVPEAASNPGLLWSLATLAWGIVFIAAAELTQDAESPTPFGARGTGQTTAREPT